VHHWPAAIPGCTIGERHPASGFGRHERATASRGEAMRIRDQGGRRLLPMLAVGLLAAFAKCEVTDPFPRARATFSLRLTGALDTLVADGLGSWTDHPKAPDGSSSHHLVLWADPPTGASTAPRVFLRLTRPAAAPALTTGVELRHGDGLRLEGSLSMECPPGDAGGRCAAFLQTSDAVPAPTLLLTRVQRDTIAGRARFAVVGALPGTTVTEGGPPDTVNVAVEFTVARNPD
jgi:hypothetical protein